MQFSTCPRCHRNRKQEAEILLAQTAARQNRVDFLEQYRFDRDAQLRAASNLADYVSPGAARQYLESQHIYDSSSQRARNIYAHIAAVEAQQEAEKLAVLMEHFGNDGKPHDFCAYMQELPYALQGLVEAKRIESAEAILIIERLYPLLANWECPHGRKPPKDKSWKRRCECYSYGERFLIQLIGVMAQLNPERAADMASSLPTRPIRAYALQQILHHTQFDEASIHRVIAAGQECITDPWQQAKFYYTLAISLPLEKPDRINYLIELAEPLLSKSPTEYYTNDFGLPTRVGPSSTRLKILKARALMKMVRSIDQFVYVTESLKAIEDLIQLDDKLQVFDQLMRQAAKWSKEDQLNLLWRIWEVSSSSGLVDVQTFIASSVHLVYSLGGEGVFWRLYHYVEWAYDELPQAGQSAGRML